jgi:DNA-binding transcriptional LysR family regulator
VRRLAEELSRSGFDLAVVSGTHVGNVDGQLAARPEGPGRLYLCLNRGSEVFEAVCRSCSSPPAADRPTPEIRSFPQPLPRIH